MTKGLYTIVGTNHVPGGFARLAALPDRAPLMLVRQPDNAFDKNAIRVRTGVLDLGYIARNEAEHLAGYIDVNGELPNDRIDQRHLPATYIAGRPARVEVEE